MFLIPANEMFFLIEMSDMEIGFTGDYIN